MNHDSVIAAEPGLPPIIGRSAALRDAVQHALRVARKRLPLLIVAPTGCGKELLAQYVHRWSGRAGELVDVNCAALPESLVESELFGHVLGAFTGAQRTKVGLIEKANGASFLLDEVSTLPAAEQGKLLRVIETQELRRVGDTAKRAIDVRFIAAAQEEIWELVRQGRFRTDLFHRLAGAVIRIPRLSERLEDIAPLVRFFTGRLNAGLAPETERIAMAYHWPGNVRELHLAVERAHCYADNGTIWAGHLRLAIQALDPANGVNGGDRTGLPELDVRAAWTGDKREPEQRAALLGALERYGWNATRAAGALGIGRTKLYDLLRRHQITRPGGQTGIL